MELLIRGIAVLSVQAPAARNWRDLPEPYRWQCARASVERSNSFPRAGVLGVSIRIFRGSDNLKPAVPKASMVRCMCNDLTR